MVVSGTGKIIIIPLFLALLIAGSCAEDWDVQQDGDNSDVLGDGVDSEGIDLISDELTWESGCEGGLEECGGECVDTDTNRDHCGVCDHECDGEEVCHDGTCLLECPPGMIECFGTCVDSNSDIFNCGSCGNICTAGSRAEPVCDESECDIICEEGWSDMDGDGSCEINCVPTSTTESCNGEDDNCDGNTDEGFDCSAGERDDCTSEHGTPGERTCSTDCSWGSCNALESNCSFPSGMLGNTHCSNLFDTTEQDNEEQCWDWCENRAEEVGFTGDICCHYQIPGYHGGGDYLCRLGTDGETHDWPYVVARILSCSW